MSSTNAALPKISYVKSIDVYLGTCFVMVFASLLGNYLLSPLFLGAHAASHIINLYIDCIIRDKYAYTFYKPPSSSSWWYHRRCVLRELIKFINSLHIISIFKDDIYDVNGSETVREAHAAIEGDNVIMYMNVKWTDSAPIIKVIRTKTFLLTSFFSPSSFFHPHLLQRSPSTQNLFILALHLNMVHTTSYTNTTKKKISTNMKKMINCLTLMLT